DPREPLEIVRHEAPDVRERLLVRVVELDGIVLGVERDDAQPVRPLGWGRRRVQLDPHLAEDAHGAVAERLEQPVRSRVGLQNAVLAPPGPAARRLLLERGRDLRPDPAPERVGVDVTLDAPDLASLAHRAIADDPVAVAYDPGVVGGL